MKRELDTKSFSTRLETSLSQCSHFSCPRFKSERHEFAIHHFAESVSYQVEGLVKKNKVTEEFSWKILTVCENEVSLLQYLVRVERKNTKLSIVNIPLLLSFSALTSQDFVPPEVVELLQRSKNALIQALFRDNNEIKTQVRPF